MAKLSALDVLPGGLQSGDKVYVVRGDGGSPETFTSYQVAVDALLTRPYDIGINRTSGTPSANEVLLDFVCPRAITLPASMTDSVAEASVAATAQTDFDVRKNGSSVATIRFGAAGTSASFINAAADSFAAGDNLTVVAPGTPDATLADIVMTLAFTRD